MRINIESVEWKLLARDCYQMRIADMLMLWVMYVVQHDGTQCWRWAAYTINTHPGQGEVATADLAKRDALSFAKAYLAAALCQVQQQLTD